MSTSSSPDRTALATPSKAATIGGRTMSGLTIAFLTWDATIKLIEHPMAVEASASLGWSGPSLVSVGAIAMVFAVLYVIPRTSVLGALLWTAYLGGAVATHWRVGNPWLSHTLFPVYMAALLWGGLVLRDRRLRAFVGAMVRGER